VHVGLTLLRTTRGVREYLVTDEQLQQQLFQREDVSACYLEGAIYYRTEVAAQNAHIRRHELQHARQEHLLGPSLFQLLLTLSRRFLGYQRCPFERQARRCE